MKDIPLSQNVQTQLEALFKDRFDILIEVLATKYPTTFLKIVEQSIALQSKKPTSILQQLQTTFEKGGVFGLLGAAAKKLFRKTDTTTSTENSLVDLVKNEEPNISYTDDNTKIKSDTQIVDISQQEPQPSKVNKKEPPQPYFEDIIEPIPIKFDGITETGEAALWRVFPPLFKDIFKDILRDMTVAQDSTTGADSLRPKSTFEEKGLLGMLLDAFDVGENFIPNGRGGRGIFKRAGSVIKRAATSVGGGLANLGRGAMTLARTPVSMAATGKAGAAGLLGTAGAIVGGEVIGGQIGKAIGSNEKFSEYWYGDKNAGKEAYEKYGTGITGFLSASWDLGKQLITNKQEEGETKKRVQDSIERLKKLDEPAKRKISVQFEKQIQEEIQRIEQIKSNTTISKEDKETMMRSAEERLIIAKENLNAVQIPTQQQTPPNTPKTSASGSPSIISSRQQSNITDLNDTEKQIFKDIYKGDYDGNSVTDSEKAKNLKEAMQQVDTNDREKLQAAIYNIQNNKTNTITPTSSLEKTELTAETPQTIQTATQKDIPTALKQSVDISSMGSSELHQEAENISKQIQTTKADLSVESSEPVKAKEKTTNIPALVPTQILEKNNTLEKTLIEKSLQLEKEKNQLKILDIASSPEQPLSTTLFNLQGTAPSLKPVSEKESNVVPTEAQLLEKPQNLNIPDNSDILTNIASNTETTNDTLKNLNGAILKLAQVFNNKLDKPSGNNIVINGDRQQALYPSASQVAASNFDPISQVRQQFGLV